MSTLRPTRRQRHYPYEHDLHERRLGREQRGATARRLLLGYLRQVTLALSRHGFQVTHTHLGEGDDLEAVLTVTPDPVRHGLPPRLVLSWAEDIGWAVSHQLVSSIPTLQRYLHSELVAPPVRVSQFLANVAECDDEVGMPYPTQFRFRGQPLRPVLDELARHSEDRLGPTSPADEARCTTTEEAPPTGAPVS